jgi:hypothetical protein
MAFIHRMAMASLVTLSALILPHVASAQSLNPTQLTHCGVTLPPTKPAAPAVGVARKTTPVIIVAGPWRRKSCIGLSSCG